MIAGEEQRLFVGQARGRRSEALTQKILLEQRRVAPAIAARLIETVDAESIQFRAVQAMFNRPLDRCSHFRTFIGG